MSFKTPKPQTITPPAPLPPPVIEDTQARAQQDAEALRRRKGRASTVLSGKQDLGGANAPQIATKQLLGG